MATLPLQHNSSSHPTPPSAWPSTMIQPQTISHAPTVRAPLQRSYSIAGYNDYADAQIEMEETNVSTLLLATPFHLASRCKSSDLVFPQKLHMLLTAAEQDKELERIVSWKVHGRAFSVHDRKRFLKEVLPEWFLQSRFESFQRQLNLYGFCRITTGPDRGACYHELFLRQKPLLAARIQRLRRKGTGPRRPAKPELEPNFYRMSLLPTYEMAKNQTNYAMRYPCSPMPPQSHAFLAPSATPIPAPGPARPISTRPGLEFIYPKPPPPPPLAQGGLCALMMRPLVYAEVARAPVPVPAPAPAANRSEPPRPPSTTSNVAVVEGHNQPSLVSAPSSPVATDIALAAPPVYPGPSFPAAFPSTRHISPISPILNPRPSLTPASASSVASKTVQQQANPVVSHVPVSSEVPLALWNTGMPAATTTAPLPAQTQLQAPSPVSSHPTPVPRCVSLLTLASTDHPDATEQQPVEPRSCPIAPGAQLATLANAAAFAAGDLLYPQGLYRQGSSNGPLKEHRRDTPPEGDDGYSDEDFALVLAELATGKPF